MKIILASTSPRRQDMLSWLGVAYEARAPGVDEEKIRHRDPRTLAKLLAEAKAEAVAASQSEGVVIGSDTVIEFEGMIIEKAKDEEDQRRLIYLRKGKSFDVISGVCLVDAATGRKACKTKSTTFWMADVSDEAIERYIKSGQGMDKGGGFGIQDENGLFISKIQGCYTNSIGFPLCMVADMLKEFGVSVRVDPKQEVKKQTGKDC